MKSRIFVTALALFGLGILDAQSANAVDFYFDPAGLTGTWNGGSDWSTDGCGGVAGGGAFGAGGNAIICSGMTVDVNAAPTNNPVTLRVEEEGLVTISGFTLTIIGSGTFVSSNLILGRIEIKADEGSVLTFTNTQVLSGGGHIVGLHATNSTFEIPDGKTITLESETRIEGLLEIKRPVGDEGTGVFVNDGLVDANAAGELKLSDLVYQDGASGVYRLSSTSASGALRFASGTYANLNSDLEVVAGHADAKMHIDVDLTTTGMLIFEVGTLDVLGAGIEAKFAGGIAR